MAIVSNAIVLSFHLKTQPSTIELRMAKPLGIVFWFLSLCCLSLGLGNYISELFLTFFDLSYFNPRSIEAHLPPSGEYSWELTDEQLP